MHGALSASSDRVRSPTDVLTVAGTWPAWAASVGGGVALASVPSGS
ncbi:hypothetical protein [Nocardioides sp. TF02-7]|nr:hypothetical protein [Nocardioides sp. TF02-7]UMG92539.1 hypothetical protein MF408_22435 [Nocardioides sp. TF02-7]